MSDSQDAKPSSSQPCLLNIVAESMRDAPHLHAIKINVKEKKLSFATLGKAHQPDVASDLESRMGALAEKDPAFECQLLSQGSPCADCPHADPQIGKSISVSRDKDEVVISRVTCPTSRSIWSWKEIRWPKVAGGRLRLPEEHETESEWKWLLGSAVACGFFLIAGMILEETRLAIWCFALAYLSGGWHAVHEVWERLLKGIFDVHFLMVAVAIGSASIGAWHEGAVLLFLFSLSGALEHYVMGRTHREIRSLFKNTPKQATILDPDGKEKQVAAEDLVPDMILLVKPNEQIPADAELIKGKTAVDESNMTGETIPVQKEIGDTLLSGTLNLWGAVTAKILRSPSQSSLQRIIHLIQQAQNRKAPSQRFTDQFGTRYTYGVIALTVLMFLVWWLGFKLPAFTGTEAQQTAFYRAMTLLVVASPCALVLSIPSSILAGIAWAARHGILFRGGEALEKLGEIQGVALDKTGTLTTGELRVETLESFPPGRESEVLQGIFNLERLSNHPLARAVTKYGKQQNLNPEDIEDYESLAGLGLKGTWHGKTVYVGRWEWLLEETHSETLKNHPPSQVLGQSEIWLLWDDLIGRITLRDDVRPEASHLIHELQNHGLTITVLTGDRQSAAEHLKKHLNLTDVRAQLSPQDKVQAIETEMKAGRKWAMIGDGVNDAPSLAAAHVGVAMGVRGSDAALEQADMVLMNDRLENFLVAHSLSLRSRTIIKQNLAISLATVALLVVLALSSRLSLPLGVLGHEGSTVLVVLNSLRLLLQKKETPIPSIASPNNNPSE